MGNSFSVNKILNIERMLALTADYDKEFYRSDFSLLWFPPPGRSDIKPLDIKLK